jgi:hypothetical protein
MPAKSRMRRILGVEVVVLAAPAPILPSGVVGRLGLIQGRDGGARQPAERRAALL